MFPHRVSHELTSRTKLMFVVVGVLHIIPNVLLSLPIESYCLWTFSSQDEAYSSSHCTNKLYMDLKKFQIFFRYNEMYFSPQLVIISKQNIFAPFEQQGLYVSFSPISQFVLSILLKRDGLLITLHLSGISQCAVAFSSVGVVSIWKAFWAITNLAEVLTWFSVWLLFNVEQR